MEAMVGTDTRVRASGFIDESLTSETATGVTRRRRTEIRRFKVIAHSGASLEHVSKRSRTVSGISYIPRQDKEATLAFCIPGGSSAVLGLSDSEERRQESSASRLPGYGIIQARQSRRAASSPSSARERPMGGSGSSSGEDDSASSGSGSISSESSGSMNSDSTSSSRSSDYVEGASTITQATEVALKPVGAVGIIEAERSAMIDHAGAGTAEVVSPIATETYSRSGPTAVGQQHLEQVGSQPGFPSPTRQALADERSAGGAVTAVLSTHGSTTGNRQVSSHGIVSLCGRRREMEDAVAVIPTFMTLPCDVVGGCNCVGPREADVTAALNFYGVYDGHGGAQAANFCADRLHHVLAEEVNTSIQEAASSSNSGAYASNWRAPWQKAMSSCFLRMDAEVAGVSWRESQQEGNLRSSSEAIAPETVGSTAVVAVVGSCQIIVANCGDSRAVLSRAGQAVPLSIDHKPEREDEMARVEAAGGRVIYWNGYRVLGVLAMSRAIGDRYLKPYVIAEPEVTYTARTEDDECLVLASDGLWDVMTNDLVCEIARRSLACRRSSSQSHDAANTSSAEESPAAATAALLTKLALAKGSSDNISVVVVDLKACNNR